MVHDAVWAAAHMDAGFLCIGCLERRLDRLLTPADFTACLGNGQYPWDSPRLAARKGHVGRAWPDWEQLR